LVDGLLERELDLRESDVIVGTSAGAIAGAWLATGAPASAFVEAMLRYATDDNGPSFGEGVDVDLLMRVYASLSAANAPLEPPDAREIASLAAQLPAPEHHPQRHVRDVARVLPDVAWPDRLLAAVVDVGTGELVLLGRSDAIPLDVGVAASCAAPGLVPPVAPRGDVYVDGGARSATNADVLARFEVTRALAVSPIPVETPMVGEATRRVLEEECRRLSESGIGVTTVTPGALEAEEFQYELGDIARMPVAIEAGRERGRREAARLVDWLE
jgi:NTE family protein